MNITYKRLTEPSDLMELERLEGEVWSGDSVVPQHMTLTLAKFGGLFMGAYDGEEMVGFLYSFPGVTDGEAVLCSHMLGFLAKYRKLGLGVTMKWMQREEALKMGYNKVTWTYDPLETVNANLNIGKLGGIVRRYIPNCYGELNDEMNQGLPTDRFLVEWFIKSERVESYQQKREKQTAPLQGESILPYTIGAAGLPVAGSPNREAQADQLILPVPAYFQQIKQENFEQAKRWRMITRELLVHYLGNGYAVCSVERDQTEPIVRYQLSKAPLDQLLSSVNA